ncbi:hypothetical protein BC567DRAFT_77823 [Phyllosticta citribraziliensis]
MLPQHATLFLFMMLGPHSFLAISSTQAPSPFVLYPAVGWSARSSCPVHSTAPRYWHSLPTPLTVWPASRIQESAPSLLLSSRSFRSLCQVNILTA